MREYSKVSPRFWTGETGKAIRAMGTEAQVIAFYLFTCPSANMLGLYYLPLPTLCHETGRPLQGALKALRRLSEGGFAAYDQHSEHVFVPEMARHQIGESLSKKDNRHKAVLKELEGLRKSPFFNDFLEKYREPFQLHGVRLNDVLPSPFEAPSKPLRSQEQEQEQKQEQKRTKTNGRKRPAVCMPEGFVISEAVKAWAEEHGFAKLEAHFEHFVGVAKAKGYVYANWDQALMNAIRDDWAKVRASGAEADVGKLVRELEEEERKRAAH